MKASKNADISRYIRDAAFSLFLEKGYDGTNIREIAEEAGYKAPSIYFYYKSKDELFLQVLEDVWQNHIRAIEKLVLSTSNICIDPKELFRKRIEAIYTDFAAYRFLLRYRVFPASGLMDAIREIYLKWELAEKELHQSIICKFHHQESYNRNIGWETVYVQYKRTLNRIINDIVISGEFIDDKDIDMYWNRLLSELQD